MSKISKRVVRFKLAQERLGIGHTKFHEDFISNGRLRVVRLGPRSCGVIEEELDALIEELATSENGGGD